MKSTIRMNEYEAAVEYGLSPDLLRWLTSNAVVDKEKLPFEEVDGVYWFNRKELEKLNTKMLGKWPLPPKGGRPTIPAGIKQEIKEEAQFSCPVCHRPQGELAHIRAVAKSYCNHPANLIYLCPNHHTEYDFGHIYQNVTLDDVKVFKEGLQRFKKLQWALKGKLIQSYLGALNTAKSLLEIHEVVKDCIDDAKFEEALKSVAQSIDARRGKNPISLTIKVLEKEIDGYTVSHSENLCPLCEGIGSTAFYHPCPICLGNGEVPEDDPRLERLDEYELVNCQLCDGEGHKDGDVCPACGGERQVPKGWAENHDWSQYESVDCSLCDGSGQNDGDVCPACGGERQVPKGWAEYHDWSQYDIVNCRLCKGRGSLDGDDCPVCHGERTVPKGFADYYDWSQHDLVNCRLCKGKGHLDGDDCPVCHGEKEVAKGFADNYDWSQHDLVNCRLCKGKGHLDGDDCPVCHGERKVTRGFADYFDWSEYK